MKNSWPIIIVDDDVEDLEIFTAVLKALNVENKILTFNESESFLEYIKTHDDNVFFILCDINMPKMNGFELCAALNASPELALRSVPFLLFSTSKKPQSIMKAYEFSIQGYFVKPSSFEDLQTLFNIIINYWTISTHPSHK